MRSWRERVLVLAMVAGGCGQDTSEPSTEECDSSPLTYQNFGEPFFLDWCRGCHSSGLPAGARQHAPEAVNFDDLDAVRLHSTRIGLRATGSAPSMPPAAGPSQAEREMLAEWLACGAR